MKTSNSEQMFIDTLRAFGLTTDLCEAVNGMRKAVMEAEGAGEGGEETVNRVTANDVMGIVRTEEQLIRDYLYEPHKKLADKLEELEDENDRLEDENDKLEQECSSPEEHNLDEKGVAKIKLLINDNKDKIYKNKDDINAIGRYYLECFALVEENNGRGEKKYICNPNPAAAIRMASKYNDNKHYADYHLPMSSTTTADDEYVKVVEDILNDKKTSEAVKKLLEDAFNAYETIEKEMWKHHRIGVPVRGRTGNRKVYGGYAYIDLDELIALLPKASERNLVKNVINTIDTGKKPKYADLKKIYDIRERLTYKDNGGLSDLDRVIRIAKLEKRLGEISPEARKLYDEFIDSFGADVSNVKEEKFEEFLDGLKKMSDESENSKMAYEIVEEIRYHLSRVYGGSSMKEYFQWRDTLNTGAERGSTVNRDPNIVQDTILVKAYKSGLTRYGKMGDGDPENTNSSSDNETWKRESKNSIEVRRVSRAQRKLGMNEKDLDNLINSFDKKIDYIEVLVMEIVKGGTDEKEKVGESIINLAENIKENGLDKDNIKKINDIVEDIKKGNVEKVTPFDKTISDILEITQDMYNDDAIDDGALEKYKAIIAFKNSNNIDTISNMLNAVNDTIDDIKKMIDEGNSQDIDNRIYDCMTAVEDMKDSWSGQTRLNDIAETVENCLKSIPEIVDEKKKEAGDKLEKLERVESVEKMIKSGENDIVKAGPSEEGGYLAEYFIPTDGGDKGSIVATRSNEVIGGVDYASVRFKYNEIDCGLWTARNFNLEVGKDVSSGDENNRFYVGRPVAVTGEGSGWMYSYDTAKKICPNGWHIPSVEEWKMLIRKYAGEVIKNSAAAKNNEIDAREGALLMKSMSMHGLDCFDFGIVPTGVPDPTIKLYSRTANTVTYFWCTGYDGHACIKFDYFYEDMSIVPVMQNFMACLRFVKNS